MSEITGEYVNVTKKHKIQSWIKVFIIEIYQGCFGYVTEIWFVCAKLMTTSSDGVSSFWNKK